MNSKVKSERASKPGDILVRQDNIRNSRLKTTVKLPAQSSMEGKYTPWIAYRGICEYEKDRDIGKSFVMKKWKTCYVLFMSQCVFFYSCLSINTGFVLHMIYKCKYYIVYFTYKVYIFKSTYFMCFSWRATHSLYSIWNNHS